MRRPLFSHIFTQTPPTKIKKILQFNQRRTREIGGTRRRLAESAFPLASFFFFEKGRVYVDAIRRLTNAGVQLESAIETVSWYRQQGDDYGLEKFIQEVESKAGKEKSECTE